MERVISATEARIHFGKWIRHVRDLGETVIVERAGKAEVVLLSAESYARLKARSGAKPVSGVERAKALRKRILERNGGVFLPPPEDVIAELRGERDDELARLR